MMYLICHNIGKYNSWTLGYKTFFYYKLMFKPFQLCTISSLVQNQTTRRNFSVHKTLFYWNVTSSLCNVFLLLIHSIKGHTFGYVLDVVFVRRKIHIKSYESCCVFVYFASKLIDLLFENVSVSFLDFLERTRQTKHSYISLENL